MAELVFSTVGRAIGSRLPAFPTAIGRAQLGFLDEEPVVTVVRLELGVFRRDAGPSHPVGERPNRRRRH